MNTHRRNLFLILGSIVGLILVLTGRVAAQDFRLLHTFTDYDFDFDDASANTDGIEPLSLIASGHTLYGITYKGGPYGAGTVFRINSDGTAFTNLYSFTEDIDINDGNFPVGNLVLAGNVLYGVTQSGGTNHNGTVFKINTDGSGLAVLHKFSDISLDAVGTNSDGVQPEAGLILAGGMLYGTTSYGGPYGSGTVFALNTNGTGFRTLYSFTATASTFYGSNTDGSFPSTTLVLSGDTLYGAASEGGTNDNGTIFAIKTNGTGFTVLHSFSGLGVGETNNDGAGPADGLVLSGDTLYGTAGYGGIDGDGTVFALNTNGTAFATLHSFSGNGDEGSEPFAGLILSSGTLYGTTYEGGTNDSGTVFALSTNGEGFTTLHSFNDDSDGDDVVAGVALIDGVLYGAARNGGTYGNGTLFSMSLGPKLLMLSSGPNMVLSWPTNTIGFTLESSSSLGSSAVWTSVSQSPVVVNANNTVTNSISGAQKFYRLSH